MGSTFGVGSVGVTAWNLAKWPIMLMVVFVAIALLYYASPNARQRDGFRWVLPAPCLLWGLARGIARLRVLRRTLRSYNKTYGSLGGIVCFLVWYWITNIAVMLGLEFNAERERNREIADGVLEAERRIHVVPRRAAKDA